jgi:recombination protein RecR
LKNSGTADPVENLVGELARLPGIGRKTAQRLAYHILTLSKDDAAGLSEAIKNVKEKIFYCAVCNNITDRDPCAICGDSERDQSVVCVVERPNNIMVIEKTGEYKGVYHVLLGAISPLSGIGPEQLRIEGLLKRLQGGGIKEIILATNPNVEGEMTASYLVRLLKPLGIKVSRIALGVPVGSELEYMDEMTMLKAMEGRREL